MTDLTEQWKRGELPSGWYYYGIHNETDVIGCDKLKMYRNRRDIKDDIEVLAPVPSYEEWKNFVDANTSLFDAVKMLEKDNFRLEKQNIELKETVEALKSELKEVCNVLIRKCPEMKEWVMLNWKNLYEVQDE